MLSDHVDCGAEVFSIQYKDPAAKSPLAALLSPGGSGSSEVELLRMLALQGTTDGARGWKRSALALFSRALAPAAASPTDAVLDALGSQSVAGTDRVARQAMATRLPGEAEPMARWPGGVVRGGGMGGERHTADDATWFL